MASFEDALGKAPSFLSERFDQDVADAFLKYVEDEEIDDIDTIIDQISSGASESAIVESIGEEFGWDETQQEALYSALRILFELEQEVKSSKLPAEIDWTQFNDKECVKTREYINKQCLNTFSEKEDASFFEICTVGRNHGIDIVPLLSDVFSFYKHKQAKPSAVTQAQFCGESGMFKDVLQLGDETHKQIYNSLVQTLVTYEHRIAPGLRMENPIKIDDDINTFISHTLSVSKMLQSVLFINEACLPLLVDLWIIPKNVKDVMGDNAFVADDEEDDDEEEEDDEKTDELSDPIPLNLGELLSKFKDVVLETGTLDADQRAKQNRVLKTAFQKVLNNSRRSVKICIVIDNRKTKDNLYVYQLPLQYSAIPRNYCNETLIVSSGEHIMYDVEGKILKKGGNAGTEANIFGAKFDCAGRMFCLSFAMHETDKTRVQFWRNGGSTRFWPSYMIDVWPKLFVAAKLDPQYLVEGWLDENFGLDLSDEVFDAWYKSIVDFEK